MDNKFQDIRSQLAHITNNFVHINDFYEGDFLIALKKAIDLGYKNINIAGEYNSNTNIYITGVDNLNIEGNCTVNFNENFTNVIYFDNCKSLKLDGLKCNFNNCEVYQAIKLKNCTNSIINNVSFENISNLDKDKDTAVVYLYSKNTNISNINLNNITNLTNPSNIGGVGSITGIYLEIDSEHTNIKIDNINATNIYNKDYQTENRIYKDCDVIRAQYNNNVNDFVNSDIYINNIFANEFGKRVVKLQAGGAFVNNISALNEFDDTCSIISVFKDNVDISNIRFKGKTEKGIEIWNSNNVNVNNINIDGLCKKDIIEIISDDTTITRKNINVSNVNYLGKENLDYSEAVIYVGANVENLLLESINVENGYFLKGVLRHDNRALNIKSVIIRNCSFNLKNVQQIYALKLYETNYLNLIIENCKHEFELINSTYPYFEIGKLTDTMSAVSIKDCVFKPKGIGYAHGSIRLDSLNNVYIYNTTVNEDDITNVNTTIDIKSNNINLNNFSCNNNAILYISDMSNVLGLKCKNFSAFKKDEENEVVPSIYLIGYDIYYKNISDEINFKADFGNTSVGN